MMIRLIGQHKVVLVLIMSLCILGGAMWGFWKATQIVWQGRIVLKEIQSKIDGLVDERQRARKLEAILRERSKDLERITDFFVDRDRPIAFIEAIERAALDTHNTIVIDVDQGKKDAEALQFRLTIDGKEADLLRYVRLLEALPHKLEIEDMTFQKFEEDTRSGLMQKPSARLLLSLRVRAG